MPHFFHPRGGTHTTRQRQRWTLVGVGLLLILISVPKQALAWGPEGHRTVAAIAFRLLPPEKAAALDNLLRTQIGVSFIDASGYADDVIRPADGDWHFVDWPLDRPDYDPVFCRSNHHEHCVVEELPRQVGIGRLATDPREQALALSWVLH